MVDNDIFDEDVLLGFLADTSELSQTRLELEKAKIDAEAELENAKTEAEAELENAKIEAEAEVGKAKIEQETCLRYQNEKQKFLEEKRNELVV